MVVYATNTAPSDSSGKHARRQEYHPPNTRDDDRTLLAQIAAGHEDALRQLYAAYRPRLWRFIAQQTYGDNELTNSVLQDVFLAVWRTAGAYRGEATVGAWLFRIARNMASNARRSATAARNVTQRAMDDADDDLDAVTHASPEQEVVDRMTLAEAFARLSAKYRVVMELVFAQGFTYDETAQILGIPLGTVKSRLSAARQALARALADPESPQHGQGGAL